MLCCFVYFIRFSFSPQVAVAGRHDVSGSDEGSSAEVGSGALEGNLPRCDAGVRCVLTVDDAVLQRGHVVAAWVG